jgi:hypothetical protein
MKKPFKIILIISLIINIGFIGLQIFAHLQTIEVTKLNIHNKYKNFTKTVNIPETKKVFFKELYKNYPETKNKKYFFINIWDTGNGWSIKQLPFLDTLIEPLNPNMAYILANDEKPDYALHIMKQDTALTMNFLFMNQCEDFSFAISQELLLKRNEWNYPRVPLTIILDRTGKIIFSDTLDAIAGPRWWPKEEQADKKHIALLKKKLSELK